MGPVTGEGALGCSGDQQCAHQQQAGNWLTVRRGFREENTPEPKRPRSTRLRGLWVNGQSAAHPCRGRPGVLDQPGPSSTTERHHLRAWEPHSLSQRPGTFWKELHPRTVLKSRQIPPHSRMRGAPVRPKEKEDEAG